MIESDEEEFINKFAVIRRKYQLHLDTTMAQILDLYAREIAQASLQIEREQYSLPDDPLKS